MIRGREPLAWGLFAAGGTVAAFLLPAVAFVVLIALPLGWTGEGARGALGAWADGAGHLLGRLALTVVLPLLFFHAAHRIRYTLYDGLQLHHLERLIAAATYGLATVMSGVALVVVWFLGPGGGG